MRLLSGAPITALWLHVLLWSCALLIHRLLGRHTLLRLPPVALGLSAHTLTTLRTATKHLHYASETINQHFSGVALLAALILPFARL